MLFNNIIKKIRKSLINILIFFSSLSIIHRTLNIIIWPHVREKKDIKGVMVEFFLIMSYIYFIKYNYKFNIINILNMIL